MSFHFNKSSFKQVYKDYLEKMKEQQEDFTKTPQKFINTQLLDACKKGDLETVKAIFSHPKYFSHVDIHHINDEPLCQACRGGHLEVVKFLLTSDTLKEKADIYAQNGHIFSTLIVWNRLDILNYLVFEYKIEERECIKQSLLDFPSKDVESMFFARKLNSEITNKEKPQTLRHKI